MTLRIANRSRMRGLPCPSVPVEQLEPRRLLSTELVTDLRTDTLGTTLQAFTTLGGLNYFFATRQNDPSAPPTLWKSDGTSAGTTPVTAVASDASIWAPLRMTPALGRLFFSNYDPEIGQEPWVSDGTPAGTHLLKDVYDPPRDGFNIYSSGPLEFTEYNGLVYFTARTEAGVDLWVTDGTAEGTRRFADLMPGGDDEVRTLAVSNGLLFFTARDAAGTGLWRTDGTTAGTVKLLRTAGVGNEITGVGPATYFVAVRPESTLVGGVWKTDGTPAGTVLVREFPRGNGPTYWWPHDLENVGGRLMFAAVTEVPLGDPPVWGLWTSDGTAAGTAVVLDRDPAPGRIVGLFPTHITPFGDGALFFGWDATAGRELWRTDGTSAGTARVIDIEPGGSGIVNDVSEIRRVGEQVFFVARDSVAGAEWWTSDGTEAGKDRVLDLLPGTASGLNAAEALPVSAGAMADGRVIFAGRDTPDDLEPWITDGTAAGTFRLTDVNTAPVGSRFRSQAIELGNGTVLFNANGRLYATRGDRTSTVLLADAEFATYAVLNGVAVFATSIGEVYRSDGTPDGTYPLRAVTVWQHYPMTPFVVSGNWVYFAGLSAAGHELWRSDGTQAGTEMVKDGLPGPPSVIEGNATPAVGAAGGVVYFVGNRDQLWRSDGTDAGTRLVLDLGAWDSASNYEPFLIGNFTDVDGRLFFDFWRAGSAVSTLWTSDGTAAGTAPLPSRVVVEGPMFSFNGAAYFGGFDTPGVGYGLYRSDGTAEGTVKLASTGDEIISSFAVLGNRLYAGGRSAVWKTDGTPAGTVQLALTDPPSGRAQIGSLTAWQGSIYFAGDDGVHGRELWRTEGDRVVLAEDIMPGPEGSDPAFIARAGDHLVFAAADPVNGKELRRLGVEVYVRGSAWSDAFRTYLGSVGLGDRLLGYRVDDGTSGILPWVNVDEVVLRYPAAPPGAGIPTTTTMHVQGVRSDYLFTQVGALDARTFALRLDRPLGRLPIPPGGENGDRVRLAVPATSFSGTLEVTFDVLPGDVDRSGRVVAGDFSDVKNRFFRSAANPGSGDTGYSVFHDVDGNGSIVATDFSEVKRRFFDDLPTAPPAASLRFRPKRSR